MIIHSIIPDHVASLITEQRGPSSALAKLRDHAHFHDHGPGVGWLRVITETGPGRPERSGKITETSPGHPEQPGKITETSPATPSSPASPRSLVRGECG
jgi:hypothetical protein